MDQMNQNLINKINELGDKANAMSPAEIADYLELTGEGRMRFLTSCASARSCWKIAKSGIDCECGGHARFAGKKTTAIKQKLGYDIFHFKCTECQKEIAHELRAPGLDGDWEDCILSEVTYELDDRFK